jgi:hypothetical protein
LFLDPTGNHLLICLESGDNFYLHKRSPRPKKLTRLQGQILECAAFDRQQGTEANTKSFLVGTDAGQIWEVSLESTGKEKLCSPVHQLEDAIAITALHFEAIPTAVDEEAKIFVLAATATPTRLYHFLGGPTFVQLFQQYSQSGSTSFQELPGVVARAELHCYSRQPQSRAQSFALMTGVGIYHGSLLFTSAQNSSENVIMEAQLLQYTHTEFEMPVSIGVTEFHFVLLGLGRLQVVSRLNSRVVQDIPLESEWGTPLALVRDVAKDHTWMHTDRQIFQVCVTNESRDVWEIYLEKALAGDERHFDTAYKYARSADERACVHEAQARMYLSKGELKRSAQYYAKTSCAFEEVVLKLLQHSAESTLDEVMYMVLS